MTLEEVLATIDYDNEVVVQDAECGHTLMRGNAPRMSKMLNETTLEAEVSKLKPHSGCMNIMIRGDWE